MWFTNKKTTMKYIDVKQKLQDKGFNPEYVQTGGYLGILSFINPNIEGEIMVHFVDPEDENSIPEEIDYMDSEFLHNIPVKVVTLLIDNLNIPYMSDDILDIYGDRHNNIITLLNDDIDKYLDTCLNIVYDHEYFLNFIVRYNNEANSFLMKVLSLKNQIVADGQYKFCFFATNGNENSVCPSVEARYSLEHDTFVLFFTMDTISFKKEVGISAIGDQYMFDIDHNIEDIKETFNSQLANWLNHKKTWPDYVYA